MGQGVKDKTIALCGGDSCCPTVTLGEKEVILRDDFGGEIHLTLEQFQDLKRLVIEGQF